MYALGQSFSLAFYMAEGLLHVTGQYSGSREGDYHRAKLAQDPVPLIHTNTLLSAGYGGEDIPEAIIPVWGQGPHHVGSVYHPPQ